MAHVYRRRKKDGNLASTWTGRYKTAGGRWASFRGSRDKKHTLKQANDLEAHETEIRLGTSKPGERLAQQHSLRPLAEHLADYRLELSAKNDTPKHINHTLGVIERLLKDAGISSLAEIQADRIVAALGRLRVKTSARTSNHARAAVLGWVRFLADNTRIREIPSGLARIRAANERVDKKLVRRALSEAELFRLCVAAAGSDTTIRGLNGTDRSVLYRLAWETGFRAAELASLTPSSFDFFDPDDPTVTIEASYSKHRRADRQPLPTTAPAWLKPWLEGRQPGDRLFPRLARTAELLRADLAAAGIEPTTADGVIDFHALRASAITHWVMSGMNPKLAQRLARHSTITLTLDRYAKTTDADARAALDRLKKDKPPGGDAPA